MPSKGSNKHTGPSVPNTYTVIPCSTSSPATIQRENDMRYLLLVAIEMGEWFLLASGRGRSREERSEEEGVVI
jgi:hypothetical protein